MKMSELLPTSDVLSSNFLIGNVGAPFAIGLAVGYFAKKMLRTALFIAGAIIVVLFVCEYYGIASISDFQLQNAASAATNAAKNSGGFLINRLSHITVKGVTGVSGFYFGFKMG